MTHDEQKYFWHWEAITKDGKRIAQFYPDEITKQTRERSWADIDASEIVIIQLYSMTHDSPLIRVINPTPGQLSRFWEVTKQFGGDTESVTHCVRFGPNGPVLLAGPDCITLAPNENI